MVLPTKPGSWPSRVPGSLNRPAHASGSPSSTRTSRIGKARSTSIRSSTVPPRPVGRDTIALPTPPFSESLHNVLLEDDRSEAEAGEYWLALKDGRELWPIVICNEEMIEKFFSEHPRPANARRAGGTWRRDFQPRGDPTGQKCFPTMYLGTWKL